MDLEFIRDPMLVAEIRRQAKLHNTERAGYLLQVALNDVARWPERFVPEDGYMCQYTVQVANALDGAKVAARIKAISPTKLMVESTRRAA
jgi:hypothetical protein